MECGISVFGVVDFCSLMTVFVFEFYVWFVWDFGVWYGGEVGCLRKDGILYTFMVILICLSISWVLLFNRFVCRL